MRDLPDGTSSTQSEPPHARHGEAVTYVLTATLDDTSPAVWRRLAVSSALHLDELHAALQAAFGWEDAHLHRFSSDHDDPGQAAYLCPFDVAEGDAGLPEELVRVGEVLATEGERLRYTYDYGDHWQVTLTLETIEPRVDDASPAVCRSGRGAEPPEDCGGVPGYEVIVGAQDPSHPEHTELLAEFRRWFSSEDDPTRIRLTPFEPQPSTPASPASTSAHHRDRPRSLFRSPSSWPASAATRCGVGCCTFSPAPRSISRRVWPPTLRPR